MTRTAIPFSCNKDCGGECALLAHVEDGRVVAVTDNPAGGPHLRGCARKGHLLQATHAPDRLTRPLLRAGPRGLGQFREVEWDEALDRVAGGLAEIKARYGNEAILKLGGWGAPRGALHHTHRLTARFLGLFGGFTYTLLGYSTAAADFVTPYVLGTTLAGIDAATLRHSKLIVLWGANVSDTRLGSEMESHIREARARGVEVIVVDPRRSNSAQTLGTQWLPVLPGADAALLMAVLYLLIRDGRVDREFVAAHSTGFEQLEQHILGVDDGQPKTPEWAERLCGTPAEGIVTLARQYGQSHPVALIPGLSIQRTLGGEEAIRLTIALQVATGNLGALGGSSGALTWGRLPAPRMGTLPIPPNPCRTAVPVVRWPDAILEGTAGGYPCDIKSVYSVGANYLMQGSDLRKSIRAFNRLELAVCHDCFLTPTARHCDVVLPASTSLERDDILLSGGNYLLYSGQAVPPPGEARTDYDIFCGLADRLGFLAEYSEGRSAGEWLQNFVAQSGIPDFQEFKRTGVFVAGDRERVGLADFAADPQRFPLSTPSGLVEISSAAYAALGASAVPRCRVLETTAEYPLRLITPHPRFRIHSQHDNLPWFRQQEKQALWIHPDDARERGIAQGQAVLVRSPEGALRIEARVTDEIMPGVVSLNEGVWPEFDADGVEVAGSANVLTSTVPTLPSGGTRTHSVLVRVERVPSLRVPSFELALPSQ